MRTNPNYNIRNPIHQNDYGFTLGGPVVIPKVYNGHDKTFFFFSFEQFRQTNFTTNAFRKFPPRRNALGISLPERFPASCSPCNGPIRPAKWSARTRSSIPPPAGGERHHR